MLAGPVCLNGITAPMNGCRPGLKKTMSDLQTGIRWSRPCVIRFLKSLSPIRTRAGTTGLGSIQSSHGYTPNRLRTTRVPRVDRRVQGHLTEACSSWHRGLTIRDTRSSTRAEGAESVGRGRSNKAGKGEARILFGVAGPPSLMTAACAIIRKGCQGASGSREWKAWFLDPGGRLSDSAPPRPGRRIRSVAGSAVEPAWE